VLSEKTNRNLHNVFSLPRERSLIMVPPISVHSGLSHRLLNLWSYTHRKQGAYLTLRCWPKQPYHAPRAKKILDWEALRLNGDMCDQWTPFHIRHLYQRFLHCKFSSAREDTCEWKRIGTHLKGTPPQHCNFSLAREGAWIMRQCSSRATSFCTAILARLERSLGGEKMDKADSLILPIRWSANATSIDEVDSLSTST
jgi:hypothetical protein